MSARTSHSTALRNGPTTEKAARIVQRRPMPRLRDAHDPGVGHHRRHPLHLVDGRVRRLSPTDEERRTGHRWQQAPHHSAP